MAGAGGSDGESVPPRMEIIKMNDKLRRNRQEIVNGLNIFLEENEEEISLEELEEEFDIFEEEETESISGDGSSKEGHDIVRPPPKVSLRSISSMTDEERLNMRIKKFGIITNEEFRKSPGNSCFGFNTSTGKKVNTDMEKRRKRLERFGHL
ncbi:hypothetical protein mRhiFer1_009940 [Rhinolophus ferrumequinum]|uniref:Uncharacterized protein n=1 Tax=Rhinolophus ferrumequinum TaxID=59479 RepID=A0A7J7YIH0_RHIFE|nr:hypothetical protein mRhiFer1_009940 [Rhinolophus ferrumequinum]